MPYLQYNDLPLLERKIGQALHGGPVGRRFTGGGLEPAARFPFALDSPPQAALVIQGPVAEAAQTVTNRLVRPGRESQKRHERVVENVFGFPMTQAQSPAVEDQSGRFTFIKRFAPS